jgi:hypothetical protein
MYLVTVVIIVIVISLLLESIQQFCYLKFFKSHNAYYYRCALENLKLHALCDRRGCSDMLFTWNVYSSFIACPSLLDTVSIRVPAKNLETSVLIIGYSVLPLQNPTLGVLVVGEHGCGQP